MKIEATALDGVFVIEPKVFPDSRGYFMETHHLDKYRAQGIGQSFVQDNLSYSVRGTLRGLHYQLKNPQAKLIQTVAGRIYDVAVDIRTGSPTFGQWVGLELSADNHRQLFVAEGFAHGFCVTSESALVTYKCSGFYDPADEGGVLWSDPALSIDWPDSDPALISDKDRSYPPLAEIPPEKLPKHPLPDQAGG